MDNLQYLKAFDPNKDYLVAIDSDGCVFDAMGIKQLECFCPMMIAYFNLQPVARAARQCKEFADLFSKTRGANRHITIARILTELLPNHPDVIAKGFDVPRFEHYCQWVSDPESLLSDKGLKMAIEKADCPKAKSQLQTALKWSNRVNELIEEIVKNVPVFKWVRESLEKIQSDADIMICSSTPLEAIEREWKEHDLLKYVNCVAGQEMGKKAEHLAVMCQKYDNDKIVMIGDAPGDHDAAVRNGVLFYPINPGDEDNSWQFLYERAIDRFFNGNYEKNLQQRLIDAFYTVLPEKPQWQ